jgi:probable DNA repair protein
MEAGLLLRSPFLAGSGEELGPRALVDAELRRKGLHEVSLTVLARVAEAMAPELARRLRGLRRALAALPTRQGASRWSRNFSRLLRVAGWPGDRAPDSFEYQAIERWNDLLSEFASLEIVSGPMEFTSALARLRHMASQTRFAPADVGSPVQVMGILEAAGSAFDHLWVTGIEDRVWPPPPRPNPFLPGPLQRERGLPHSSADRELAYARAVTARLLASAAEVLVSYPLRDADSDLRPSPLIGGLPETNAPIGELDSIRTLRRSFPGLLQQEDSSGPRLPEGALQRGGMGILEKQAACPFRAFAEFRLGARPLEEPSIGLSPQERGKVLHAALQILWSELKTHASLMASAAPDLEALLSRSVRQALVEQVRNRGAESMPHLQSLEQKRLERLLATWLEIERTRSPFEVVASERKRRIRIGGMEIDIQVDRVDSLEDGRHVIIDYKAGDPNPNQWEGDRPDAPQLPLYAATHESPLAAVAFARLAPGESGFKGLGEDAGIPGVADYSSSKIGKAAGDTLAAHIEEWARTVERLALEFAAGSADVVPKRYDTCDHCALPALCRIGEIQGRMGGESEPEDADG